ncbi:MAG TPA: hypothetical protein VJ894_03600 [Cryomorphaceae bacterium]|nr:hypothetical protein [Cryomorphaceae bacterium]
MTESEARLLLGVSPSADSEGIMEAYEEAVFEQASFFMRRVFIPQLAKARIKKLESLYLAAKTLGLAKTYSEIGFNVDFSSAQNHEEVLERYNRAETEIKLRLSNTSSSTEAKKLFESWIQLFKDYRNAFLSFCDSGTDSIPAKLTEAKIFVEYRNAPSSERSKLIEKECARLLKIND